MRKSGWLALWMACVVCFSIPAYADKKAALKKTQAEQDAAESKAEELEAALEAVEEERASIKSDLVRITKTLQKHERSLQKVEKRQAEIQQNIKARETSLSTRRKELDAMMAAAVRLSQVPPEAGLMMPEYSEQTVEAASALKLMTHTIKVHAEEIRKEMAALEEDQAEADRVKKDIDAQMQEIKKKRQALDAMFKEKDALATSMSAEQKQLAKRARQLAKEASSLQQLISSLDKPDSKTNMKSKGMQVKGASNTGGKRGKLRSFLRAKGDIRPPGSGEVVAAYNQSLGDEHSRGITIQTASGATVSAPYDGEVVFSGIFRRYGNMIILKHADGFHTLIAGLQKIRANTGEFLLEGEPIGAMGNGVESRKLYVELRKDNQPINPSSWFEGL